jgi:hypothetical protein
MIDQALVRLAIAARLVDFSRTLWMFRLLFHGGEDLAVVSAVDTLASSFASCDDCFFSADEPLVRACLLLELTFFYDLI